MEKIEKATFAAGCFWGVQDAFDKLDGVISTTVGYSGGKTKNPTYEDVCSHTTGHAEATLVEYDSNKISYEELVNAFFNMHNPTTVNKQGPDIGDQYRSSIFFHTSEQEETAKKIKDELDKSGKWDNPIVTEIVPATEFYKAEEYHQKYFQKTGQSSCHI
ncbi:peptide-methionine (S)-S-oxide reductase MsrA [Candidatus Peregrinibacteria bacterium]|nr:peptide-methionine (S)-S-oxide reductase MsrA [Candidatus Peregrinibacteria bacterium]